MVTNRAIGLGLDQGRAIAAPRPVDGFSHDLVHREHIITVDGNAGDAIGCRARCDFRIEGG